MHSCRLSFIIVIEKNLFIIVIEKNQINFVSFFCLIWHT